MRGPIENAGKCPGLGAGGLMASGLAPWVRPAWISTPSLRRMWTIYKKILVEDGMSHRDQGLVQRAFYGARRPQMVFDHLVEDEEVEALERFILPSSAARQMPLHGAWRMQLTTRPSREHP
jgi:hypothetical protein